MRNFLAIAFLVFFINSTLAQEEDTKLVQFSGFVMTADSLMGVPYANVYIKNQHRGMTTSETGFFSFAAHEGDTLIYTSLGYKPAVYIIPSNLSMHKYSVIQLMTKTAYYLKPAFIFPWGDRGNFEEAFRKLKVPKGDIEKAEENTNRQLLAALGESLPIDGAEASERYLRSQSAKTYYYGQMAPQNIGSPLAWAEFIKAWKRGDFKKKQRYVPTSNN